MYRTNMLVFFLIIGLTSHAQHAGVYSGKVNGMTLRLETDSTAYLSFRLETSVSFKFSCKTLRTTDSSFILTDIRKTADTIYLKKRRKSNHDRPLIYFILINEVGEKANADLVYELRDTVAANGGKGKNLLFRFNFRNYCYFIPAEIQKADVVIDVTNSFLIANWVIRGDQLIPYINHKAEEKWIVTKE